MKTLKKIIEFLANWNEFITIPLALLLWYLSPMLLRTLDPTAGVYDAGIFQVILFTVIQFLVYHGVAWIVFKITFPKAYKYFDNKFENAIGEPTTVSPEPTGFDKFQKLTTWQKCVLVLVYFSLCLLSMVFLARVL